MTRAEIVAALMLLPGVLEADTFTLKAGVAWHGSASLAAILWRLLRCCA